MRRAARRQENMLRELNTMSMGCELPVSDENLGVIDISQAMDIYPSVMYEMAMSV